MARETTLTAIHAARSIRSLPDGSPIPSPLSHALIVLATYWPNIWPSQERLAEDMNVSRRSVNRRLRQLEAAGLIRRQQRTDTSTRYWLKFAAIRNCSRAPCDASVPIPVTPASHKVQVRGNVCEGDQDIPF